MNEELNLDDAAVEAHLKELKRVGLTNDDATELSFIYDNLNILDSKSASLLSFNAVGLAALAVWLSGTPRDLFHLVLDVAFLSFLASCFLCLRVVWVHWISTADLKHTEKETRRLLRLRDSRTKSYRYAWAFSFLAVLITGLASIYHTVETARNALW